MSGGRGFEPGLSYPTTGKFSVNPKINGYMFRTNQESIRQRKEKDGFHFPLATPEIRFRSPAPHPHCPYGRNTMGYIYLNLFLGSELYLHTLHKRQVGQGYHASTFKSFCVNATAVNCIRGHNNNAFAYRFKLRS